MANLNAIPSYSAGTINEIAQTLYDELLTSGSSLMLSEVTKFLIEDTKKYVGWAGGLQIKPDDIDGDLTNSLVVLDINETTQLATDEWVIIEPVLRAHCEVLQAGRMEGAQGLGVAPSGPSKSEADMLYKEAVLQMQKEAFQCEPFTVDLTDSKRDGEPRHWVSRSLYATGYRGLP
ncbi:hypothetical protein [Psychrobacter sp. I-STPA10]|uniref:hypothetical protein n=1 Tax=Psychrobacter sp. I-STPA10 TaxID=2585769 RepID=UPI001E4512F8|nr:hypothetical protein [Psychrobacter sp. I-STPA10]